MRGQIHELQVQIHELRVKIYGLRVQIHELRVQFLRLTVQFTSYEFRSTSWELISFTLSSSMVSDYWTSQKAIWRWPRLHIIQNIALQNHYVTTILPWRHLIITFALRWRGVHQNANVCYGLCLRKRWSILF